MTPIGRPDGGVEAVGGHSAIVSTARSGLRPIGIIGDRGRRSPGIDAAGVRSMPGPGEWRVVVVTPETGTTERVDGRTRAVPAAADTEANAGAAPESAARAVVAAPIRRSARSRHLVVRDLLARWRAAERAVALTRPGTRANVIAVAQCEDARDAYQAAVVANGDADREANR